MAAKKPSLARKLANPGERSKLPDSALTMAQLAERQRLARVKKNDANPLYDPSAQLSGNRLLTTAQSLTDLSLKPKLAAYDTQAAQEKANAQALADRAAAYSKQQQANAISAQQRMAALASMTNQAVSNVQGASQQALQQQGADEQARQQADAALRGGGLGGDTGTVGKAISEAAATQGVLQPAQAAQIAAQGQGWAGLQNAIAGTTSLRGQETQQQLSNAALQALAKVQADRAATEATRGDALAGNINTLRQQSYENAVTQQGLGLKQADLQATIRGQDISAQTAAANRAQSAADRAAGRAVTRHGQGLSHEDRLRKLAADKQKKTLATRAAGAKAWGGVENVIPLMNATVDVTDATGNVTGKRPATTQETLGALRARKIPEWQIQAALDIRHHGVLSQKTVDLIHRTAPDVRIPNKYRPRRIAGADAVVTSNNSMLTAGPGR